MVKAAEYKPRLLQVKGAKKGAVKVSEVNLKADSLNDGDVFILDNGLTLVQWYASVQERAMHTIIHKPSFMHQERGEGEHC